MARRVVQTIVKWNLGKGIPIGLPCAPGCGPHLFYSFELSLSHDGKQNLASLVFHWEEGSGSRTKGLEVLKQKLSEAPRIWGEFIDDWDVSIHFLGKKSQNITDTVTEFSALMFRLLGVERKILDVLSCEVTQKTYLSTRNRWISYDLIMAQRTIRKFDTIPSSR